MPETAVAGTVARGELVAYLDALLEAAKGEDYCPNGLQVEGRARIRRLVTGVSACRELFAAARERAADAVLVHHGIFWKGSSPVLTGIHYARVRELVLGEINLLAYHLPLDRHPELGNNALAARAFGLVDLEPCAYHGGEPTGFSGRFAAPIPAAELLRRTREVYGREPLAFPCGPDPVRTLAVVSGAAQRELHGAIAAGLDAFLTGEVSEWVMNVAREAGIHYLAAGHYATERLGVRALGEHLAGRFGIEVEFIDVENPV
ncbi:MAG TPA: Nif3-like dinuclear metal center hexameric protein [Thermoanaerobaculia bacterium]|jgi:dinuclear metal center YbgI/SA1388 family protein